MTFDGGTYQPERDKERLSTEMAAVKAIMLDGEWHTLPELHALTGYPLASALDSRLRDLRKPRFGGYLIDCEYVHRGLHRYRLRVPAPVQMELV